MPFSARKPFRLPTREARAALGDVLGQPWPTALVWGLLPPLAALTLEWAAWDTIQPFVWLLFFPAVFIASLGGGLLSGLLATALSVAITWYVFLPPALSWSLAKPALLTGEGIFLITGILMSGVMEWARQADRRTGHRKFEALVEQSLAGIYIAQGDRLRYVNPEFARILGYAHPDELIDRVPLEDLVMPDDRLRVSRQMQAHMAQVGLASRHTLSARHRDGRALELDIQGRTIQTPTGPAVVGLILDVTEARRQEQLLRAVIDGTTDAVFVKDLDGRYLLANPPCTRIMGLSTEQLLGRRASDLFLPAVVAQIEAEDRQIRDSKCTTTRELQMPLPSGVLRTLRVTKGPMLDGRGQVSGMFGISHDITDLMAAQATLQEKQALLDRMSSLARVGGWRLDVRTMQGSRTAEACRILDLDPDTPLAMGQMEDVDRFFAGSDRARLTAALQRAIAHAEPFALELALTSAKGVRKWVRSMGEPIVEAGRVVRVEGAIQDISEVAQARQALQAHQAHLEQTVRERTAELETARQEAERLSQVKSAFLANMSHEIRTPLHGVLGLAQIGLREHSGTAHRTFARILESGEVLLGVVNDILDFSKIEAGMLHVEAVPVPLPALLHRAGAQIQAAAQAKGLALRIEVSDALPPACLSDPLRLEQILLNLLSNALKFTTAGQITLAAGLDQGQLHLSVRDTGIGMSADQQARLFRPFEQADGSTTRQYGGTGLGLSITHRLTELLGGRIAVHSQPGRGTCFDVWLPLRTPGTAPPAGLAPRPPAAARPPAEPATPVPRLAGLRVLAAEDNPVNQMVLKEFLRMEGARVTLVDNGQSAVDTVAQQGAAAFDVVLMDIQMPGMDGYEATRRLRGLAPDLPVIGQTAHAMPEEHAKCLGAGMVDLVVKPIDFAQLVETVGRHVRAPQTD